MWYIHAVICNLHVQPLDYLPMQLAGISDLDGKRLMLTGMHGSGTTAMELPKLSSPGQGSREGAP